MILKKIRRLFLSDDIEIYLRENLNKFIDDIYKGMKSLSFGDNFESFEYNGTISAGSEVTIAHNLNVIPTKRIIVRQSGDVRIIDGDTAWTTDNVYLKNTGGVDATVKVIFFK